MGEIVAGIASIPEREQQLEKVLRSLHGQVDIIELALNGYDRPPDYLERFPKVRPHMTTNKMGDANKFLKVGDHPDAYYFSCDDDIIYPPNYAIRYIKHMVRYRCLVTIHGSDMPERTIKTYYSGRIFKAHCLHKGHQCLVDIAGSGVSAFPTSILKLDYERFTEANMADIFLSMQACEQNVPRLAIAHRRGWIRGGLNKGQTIYDKHKNDDKVQTDLVNNFNWRQNG